MFFVSILEIKPAEIAEVIGSNMPAVILGGHSSGSLTIPRCIIGTRS